jgi:uncharacterized membrane protein (UPF0182 family)
MRRPSDLPPRGREPRRRRLSNRGRALIITIVVLFFVLFLSARGIAGFYTDFLWYKSLDRTDVFTGVLGARIALAVIFTGFFAVVMVLNLFAADRLAPSIRPSGPEEQIIERYHQLVGRRQWQVRIVFGLLLGLVAGVPVSSQWRDWLLFTHAQRFGTKDSLFHLDIGFYVFRLPFLLFMVNWLFASLVIILIVTALAHYLNGGIRLQAQGRRVTPQVKLHISLLLAVLALIRAAGYWLERYELTTSGRGFLDGALYTAARAQLPVLSLLALISVLAAVLLMVNVRQKGWRLPVIAVGLWGVVVVVAGTIYPAIVQRFVVENSEQTRERPYIGRNIEATLEAYGLKDLPSPQDLGAAPVTAQDVEAAQPSLENVRLLDPVVTQDAFKNLKAPERFYQFNELDVDRYQIDGQEQQVLIAARELQEDEVPRTSWIGQHLIYTHGYNVAVAPANKVDNEGHPDFIDPTTATGDLKLDQPEIYFGEQLESYAVVATKTSEVSLRSSTEEIPTTYTGTGGVKLSSIIRRAAFALRFGEPNLILSPDITSSSRILFVRDIRERVKKLAPFLSLDADPYPVIVDGKLQWIIDAYTTTSRYPYAQHADTSGDAVPTASGLRNASFNYLRNSVKIALDAYTGSVKFYVVDESDPIIRSYASAFPSMFVDASQASPELRAHFRSPEDLFRMQTAMYARYHVTDVNAFYTGNLAWSVAKEPGRTQQDVQAVTQTSTGLGGVTTVTTRTPRIAPYYTLLQLPGDTKPQFVQVRPFAPVEQKGEATQLLEGFMTVSSEPGSLGQLRVFTDNADPKLPGPAQLASNISSTFAGALTLLDNTGSEVLFGTPQFIPAGGGLIFLRPWYVQPAGSVKIPALRCITVLANNRYVNRGLLEDALRVQFPEADVGFETSTSGTLTGSTDCTRESSGDVTAPTTPTTVPSGPSTSSGPTTSSPSTSVPEGGQTVDNLLAQAAALRDAAQTALTNGDPTTAINDLKRANDLLLQAAALATGTSVPTSTTTIAPTATTTTSAPPASTASAEPSSTTIRT